MSWRETIHCYAVLLLFCVAGCWAGLAVSVVMLACGWNPGMAWYQQ